MGWLRSTWRLGVMLREVRKVRLALERIAVTLEHNAGAAAVVQPSAEHDAVSIGEVDPQLAAEFADIELGLTHAKGIPPTEDEILAAYNAIHSEPEDPRRLTVLEGRDQSNAPLGRA